MSEDGLTGLHDRRAFLLALRRQVGMANEKQSSVALAVVDIDGFATINGMHGFDVGLEAVLSRRDGSMGLSLDALDGIGEGGVV